MKRALICLCMLLTISFLNAQDKKTFNITKTDNAPKIDGVLDDAIWDTVEMVTDFVQYDPNMGDLAKIN